MPKLQRKARQWSSFLHTWIGLIGGLLLAVLGVSGAIIGMKPQIEQALFPSLPEPLVCHAEASLEGVEARLAERNAPPIDRIYFSQDQDPRVHLRLETSPDHYQHLVYDSCTQRILGEAQLGWLDWLVDLHHNLLAGKTGRRFVGAIGIVMLVSAFSGLLIWLLSNPRWRHFFSIQTKANSRRLIFDLHRSLGLIATAYLVIQALSGIYLSYPQTIRAGLSYFTPVPTEKRMKKKASMVTTMQPLQSFILAVRHQYPEARIRELRLSPTGPVSIKFSLPGDVRPTGVNQVQLDRASAEPIHADLIADQPTSSRGIEILTAIHYADWGGVGPRLLSLVLGFSPLVLTVSGFLIWWLPRRKAATRLRESSAKPALVTAH